jgi:hypothetical protein
MADRYWFLGSFAGCLVVAWALSATGRRRSGLLAVAMLVGGCMLASLRASTVWGSEVDLWTFIARTAPASPRSWSGLSRVHRLAEQEALAERALDRALAIQPDHLPSRAARVFGALWFGRLERARAELSAIGDRDGLHGDALRIVKRCSAESSAEAARQCVRRTVPAGMILGDPERLRVVSERLLNEPLATGTTPPPARYTPGEDAGADAGGAPGAAGSGGSAQHGIRSQ